MRDKRQVQSEGRMAAMHLIDNTETYKNNLKNE